jgi:uncharacterized protein (UPF0335 family)
MRTPAEIVKLLGVDYAKRKVVEAELTTAQRDLSILLNKIRQLEDSKRILDESVDSLTNELIKNYKAQGPASKIIEEVIISDGRKRIIYKGDPRAEEP